MWTLWTVSKGGGPSFITGGCLQVGGQWEWEKLGGLGVKWFEEPAEHQTAATDLVYKWMNFEMQNIISAEGRHISWWFTWRSRRLCWVHFRSSSAKRKYADGRDSARVSGKDSGARRNGRKGPSQFQGRCWWNLQASSIPFRETLQSGILCTRSPQLPFTCTQPGPCQYCWLRL